MSQEIEQFIPLIIVVAGIWLILRYYRNKKGITGKDDGSDEIKKAAFKTGKVINKSLLGNKKLIKIGAGIILIIIVYQYFSPYQDCKRALKKDGRSALFIERTCKGK